MSRCSLFVSCLFMSITANAHHSFGAFYDMSQLVELEGEITAVFWRNPHIRFTIDVVDSSGAVASWKMEAGSVNTLQRFGIGEEIIRVGSRLRVSGPPSRHGLDTMFVVFVVPPGGDEVVLNPNLAARVRRSGGDPLPQELVLDDDVVADARATARSIFRVWTPRARPNTGSGTHVWPLTPAGQAGRDAWDALADDPALRCIPPGIPVAMDNPYPIDFTEQGDDIVMRLEGGGSSPIQPSDQTIVTWSESETAPYYCVEPWMGPPNSPENKKGLHFVPPKKTGVFSVEVSLG